MRNSLWRWTLPNGSIVCVCVRMCAQKGKKRRENVVKLYVDNDFHVIRGSRRTRPIVAIYTISSKRIIADLPVDSLEEARGSQNRSTRVPFSLSLPLVTLLFLSRLSFSRHIFFSSSSWSEIVALRENKNGQRRETKGIDLYPFSPLCSDQSKSIYEHVIQIKRAFNRVSQFFSTKFIFIFYKILI